MVGGSELGGGRRDFGCGVCTPEDVRWQWLRHTSPFARGESVTFEEIYRVRHERAIGRTGVLARARKGIPAHRPEDELMRLRGRRRPPHREFDPLRKREERFRLSLSALRGLV